MKWVGVAVSVCPKEGSVAEVARTRGLEGRRSPGRRMEEQETIVRFDRAGSEALLYTADRNQANRWTRRGYAVRETTGGWEATVPKRLVSFRRVGSRQGKGKGKGKGAVREVA